MMATEILVAVARLAEASGGAVLFGAPLLLRLAGTPAEDAGWAPGLLRSAAVVLGLGSLAALLGQTVGMAGSWREGLSASALGDVLGETAFGRSVLVRVALAAAVFVLARRVDACESRTAPAALGAAALASLAWSGHGAADAGAVGLLHLGGDLIHLLSAGAWLGALAALVPLSGAGRRTSSDPEATGRALTAFSGVGGGVVAALLASGLVNGWFLVGPHHWRELPGDPWGRLLLAKLALFTAMLVLAALNRWRWTPALLRSGRAADALPALRRSVGAEATLGLAVLAAAAVMGGLAPPMSRG